MIVEIKGVDFVNKGAELMLLAVLAELRARFPAAEIALAPNANSPYAARARLAAWQSLPLSWRGHDLAALAGRLPATVSARLARYGIVTEPAIDAVLDASGYAYGDAWPASNLARAAAAVERYARRGRPYVFLPQAFGPFTAHRRQASRFGAALDHATLVYAREPASRAHLAGLDARLAASVRLAPDFTLRLPGDAAAGARWGVTPATVLLVPNAHMLRPGAAPGRWADAYLPFMAAVARACRAEGIPVRLLNHEGAGDAAACRQIAEAGGGLGIIEDADPRAVKGVLGAAGAVVSSRYHGCVSALSQSVPCLGTSWSHKYAALYAEFGVPGWLLPEPDATAAAQTLLGLLRAPGAARAALARAAEGLKAQSAAMWAEVGTALGGHR